MVIDVTFDVRSDARGKDPDSHSATLREFHRQLWSRPLPDGSDVRLAIGGPGTYLRLSSPRGDWSVGSDSIIHTYGGWRRLAGLLEQIPLEEIEAFRAAASTVGGYIVFPVAFNLKPTINQARGTRAAISDRFDVTLECIRRHYAGLDSPLADVLGAYGGFFDLYGSFEGYVDYFLLGDLIDSSTGRLLTFLPFDTFGERPVPTSVDEYRRYRDASVAFVEARNARIAALSTQSR